MTAAVGLLDGEIQSYLDHLDVERGVAANTLSSYRRDLRRYQQHLADRKIDRLAEVCEADVSDFVVTLRRGDPENGVPELSASSAAQALIAVRGCTGLPPSRAWRPRMSLVR